jgi:hypothetical protein
MNTIQAPAPATMQAPKPITMTNQPGAPTLASMPISTPALMKTTGNTLDDVVKGLAEMKTNFVEAISGIKNNPVVVTLQGDAQKFMKIVNTIPAGNQNALVGV